MGGVTHVLDDGTLRMDYKGGQTRVRVQGIRAADRPGRTSSRTDLLGSLRGCVLAVPGWLPALSWPCRDAVNATTTFSSEPLLVGTLVGPGCLSSCLSASLIQPHGNSPPVALVTAKSFPI